MHVRFNIITIAAIQVTLYYTHCLGAAVNNELRWKAYLGQADPLHRLDVHRHHNIPFIQDPQNIQQHDLQRVIFVLYNGPGGNPVAPTSQADWDALKDRYFAHKLFMVFFKTHISHIPGIQLFSLKDVCS